MMAMLRTKLIDLFQVNVLSLVIRSFNKIVLSLKPFLINKRSLPVISIDHLSFQLLNTIIVNFHFDFFWKLWLHSHTNVPKQNKCGSLMSVKNQVQLYLHLNVHIWPTSVKKDPYKVLNIKLFSIFAFCCWLFEMRVFTRLLTCDLQSTVSSRARFLFGQIKKEQNLNKNFFDAITRVLVLLYSINMQHISPYVPGWWYRCRSRSSAAWGWGGGSGASTSGGFLCDGTGWWWPPKHQGQFGLVACLHYKTFSLFGEALKCKKLNKSVPVKKKKLA